MRLICPACGKEGDGARECSRCGCDLTILERILGAAERELHVGRDYLEKGCFQRALHCARESWRLRKNVGTARFAFIAALAAGDFDQAGIWYARTGEQERPGRVSVLGCDVDRSDTEP